jgi:hypothetical protein
VKICKNKSLYLKLDFKQIKFAKPIKFMFIKCSPKFHIISFNSKNVLSRQWSLQVRAHLMCYAAIIWSSWFFSKNFTCGLFKMMMINDCLNVFRLLVYVFRPWSLYSSSINLPAMYRNIMAGLSLLYVFNHFDCINWNEMVLWFNPAGGESDTRSSFSKSHCLQVRACYCKSMLRYKYVPWFRNTVS